MTEIQAAQIESLRIQAKGYKAIASAVGLSRDIVRNYCKANGMGGFGEAAAMNTQNRQTSQSNGDSNSQSRIERTDA